MRTANTKILKSDAFERVYQHERRAVGGDQDHLAVGGNPQSRPLHPLGA